MKKYFVIIYTCLILILLTGCETKVNQDASNTQSKAEDSTNVVMDSTKIKGNNSTPADSFKVDESVYGLKEHISWLKELWSNVENPLIVTYSGSEWGDYFHLRFTDSDERIYDFGDGSNNFENIGVSSDELPDNFTGMKFKIYWDWKLSSFTCCEGMMNSATAKVPSITRIEQVKDSTDIKRNNSTPADTSKVNGNATGQIDPVYWEKELWNNVEKTLIVTYDGSEWGDYFYLSFLDSEGRSYEFGNGDNNFMGIGINADDLPEKYIGKKFKITWDWKLNSFNCCEGNMDSITAYVASVVNIGQIRE